MGGMRKHVKTREEKVIKTASPFLVLPLRSQIRVDPKNGIKMLKSKKIVYIG